jgi:hypothetical protein
MISCSHEFPVFVLTAIFRNRMFHHDCGGASRVHLPFYQCMQRESSLLNTRNAFPSMLCHHTRRLSAQF